MVKRPFKNLASLSNKNIYKIYERLIEVKIGLCVQSQPTLTCSKSTMKTAQFEVSNEDVSDVVLVALFYC